MSTVKKKLTFNKRMRGCINATKIMFKENYFYQVSALTFDTLLAIVPLITVSIYISVFMPIFDIAIYDLKMYVFKNFLPETSQTMDHYLTQFVGQAVKLPVGGAIFLFVTVAMLMILVKNTMNDVWHSSTHGTWTSIIISWIVLITLPLLIGMSIFSSYYFLSLSWVHYTVSILGLDFILTSLVPIFINMLAFSMLYYFAPNCHVWAADSLFGGLTAAILFEISKRIFEFYIMNFANYDVIYGSLAIIPTFMIWVYISWSIIIYGAVVTYAQNQQRI